MKVDKRKSLIEIIAAIICSIILLVVIVVGIKVFLSNTLIRDDNTAPTWEASGKRATQNDTKRLSTLSHVVNIIREYQSNNRGKIPFNEGKVNSSFIKKYIDNKCVPQDANGLTYDKCSDSFKTPYGKSYSFSAPMRMESDTGKFPLEEKADLDKIYVFLGVRCGDSHGDLHVSYEDNSFALLMRAEGQDDVFICKDNA